MAVVAAFTIATPPAEPQACAVPVLELSLDGVIVLNQTVESPMNPFQGSGSSGAVGYAG